MEVVVELVGGVILGVTFGGETVLGEMVDVVGTGSGSVVFVSHSIIVDKVVWWWQDLLTYAILGISILGGCGVV